MVLPSDYPVQDYSLSPITIGGHMLQDTLLSLKTLDKGSTGSTLTFSIPANDPKASLVKEEVVFTFKGKSYRIKNVQTITQGMGKVISVYAERFWYNFMTHQVSVNPRELNQNAEYWINDSMEMWKRDGVPWTAGQVDNDRYLDLSIPPSSSLEQLKAVEEIWGGYLVFDEVEQKVHLLENPGRNRGTPLVYNKDVKSITKTVDTSTLTTRLYVRNADDDWIADVNGGKSYVENFEYTEDIKSDFYRFDAAYSPEAMLIAAQYMVDQLSKPRITYEVSLSGMRDRIHEIDRFEVMDTVFIQDEDYSESVLARVVELEIDYLDLSRSRIILGSHTKNLASPTPGTPLLPSRISEFGTKPAKPMGINGSSEGYFEGLIPKSEITIYWPAVTESDTGKDIRISHYEVKISGGRSTETTDLSTTFTGLEPGIPVDVSVCAVSIDGVPSLWSDSVEIVPEAPVVVLETPTSPNLASSLGTVTVAWDKMLKNGVFPTRYLKHLIVNESLDGNTWYEVGTVTVDTPNINLSRTNQRGNTLHYRFIAEDILGGYSPESDTTNIRVASVLDDTEIGSLDQRIEDAQEDANSALDAVLDVKDQVDKAVTGTSVEYAVSNDPNVTPTSGWSTTSPAWVNGRYIFMRTVVTYGDDTTTTTEPVILTGPSGEQGEDGLPGNDGKSIEETTVEYTLSTSGTVKPTSGWSLDVPTLIQGRYLWTRITWTYSDNSSEYGYSVSLVAKDGSDGEDGLAGKDGVGISNTTIHYAKSSSGTVKPTSGWSLNVPATVPGDFLWTRTTWSYDDGTSEAGFSVGKIGDTGAQGVSVTDVVRFYRLVSTKPAKPTVLTPSGWSTSEPVWDGVNTSLNLYYTDRVRYSNNQFSWSDVQLSSAFEVAKAALFKADNTVVNGRNLWYNSASPGSVQGSSSNATTTSILGNFLQVLITGTTNNNNVSLGNADLTTHPDRLSVIHWDSTFDFYYDIPVGTDMVVSFDVMSIPPDGTIPASTGTPEFYFAPTPGYEPMVGDIKEEVFSRFFLKFKWQGINRWSPHISFTGLYNPQSLFLVRNFKLEQGTQATGWTPNPMETIANARATQRTLDGLNARFTQTFEPYKRPNGGGELQNGDEWFKTNSSDQIVSINIYNGSKWVPKQLVADSVIVPSSLGTISLKDGAITAPKITASSQLSAKAAEFMELDVSKLRAGSGTFDSAVAGTLKTTVLEAGSITTEMLQVGVQPPSASATERVPASLRDSVYWNKVKSGEIVIQDRVSSYPTSVWTSNAEGLQARAGTVWIPITGRNPVPESREITVTVKGGDKVVGTPFWIYVYYSTSQEGSYANISRQHTTLVDGSYTSTFIFPEGSYDYHVALHKTHSTNWVTYSSASVVESLGSVDGGKTVSISPSRVEMKNGNESTLLTSEGFTHTNSSGQADVRIGHGIPTGMEIRNPRTGSLAPLANIVYGVDHVRDSSSLAYYTLNSGSKAAISKYSGSFKLTSTSDRYLILVNYEMDARALSMDIQLGYSRLSTGSPTNQSVDKTTHAFMIPIETGGSLGTSFARNNRVSRTDSFYFGGMSVGLPHYFNLMFTPTNFISNTGNSATSGSVGVAINSMTFIPL